LHNIEPFFRWRDHYIASDDERSPFFGRQYSEFFYTHKIYNHLIHPQWDDIGSESLFLKVLFVDYEDGYALIELLGEWNDCHDNDFLTLRQALLQQMGSEGIFRFIFLGDNLLNFHADDDSYYEEWAEELRDENGWAVCINFRGHVIEEMRSARLHQYLEMPPALQRLNWRQYRPQELFEAVSGGMGGRFLTE
jgi:hypothetical protein